MPSEEPREPSTGSSEDTPGTGEVASRNVPEKPRPDSELSVDAGTPPKLDDMRERESERPPPEAKEGKRNRFDSLLPGLIRRGIEKGIEAGLSTFEKSLETGRETTDAVREVLSEVRAPRDVAHAVGKALGEAKLPREIATAVFSQLDDTKNDVLRIIAGEFRDFLEATDLAGELKNALTSLSFEVRTEVRFIPNEAGTGLKADVRSQSKVKRNPQPPPPRRRARRRRRVRRDDD